MRSLLILLSVFFLSACGIKGKPLPPLPEEPLPSVETETASASAPATVKPLKTLPAKKKSN